MVTGKLIFKFIELLSVGLDNRFPVPLRLEISGRLQSTSFLL